MSDLQQEALRKRRSRKIWSCLECRRKKVQCDHGQPACGRCSKAGRAASCVYAADATKGRPGPASSQGSESIVDGRFDPIPGEVSLSSGGSIANASDSGLLARLKSLEEKLAKFESSSVSPRHSSSHAVDGPGQHLSPALIVADADVSSPTANEPNKTPVHGSGFRTRYNGSTSAAHLAEHIPGFAPFTTDAFAAFSAFDQIKEYLNRSEGRTALVGPSSTTSEEAHLKSLIPSQAEADRLTAVYFEGMDSVYAVIHRPTFEEYYSEIYLGQIRDARHVVVLLLLVAIAKSLISAPTFTADIEGRTPRDQATVILDGCECWIQTRIHYFDTILDYQIGFLLLLGRLLNARRNKRTWCNAAHVARVFWCSGMHREPIELGPDTTHLDRAMRRRLWASITDLELQAAFEHGMPALSWPLQANVRPPANAYDRNIGNADSAESRQTFTKSSFLALAGESLILRHELNSILNDTRTTLSFGAACEFTKRLKAHLQALPSWSMQNAAVVTYALLAINLHQYILALHEQQLRNSSSPIEQQFSRVMLVESATQIMDCHQKAVASGSTVVEILYGTHMRAALSIGLAYCTLDPHTDRILAVGIEHPGFRAVEQAIEMFSEKAMRFSGSRNLWYICAIYGLMKSVTNPEKRDSFLREAVDTFTKPFYRLMALRKDLPSPSANRPENALDAAATADTERQRVASPGWQTGPKAYDTLLAGPDKLADWAFEDWTFDDFDFLNGV